MVRSYWKRTLVTSLAWAGLAWGQQPVSSPPKAPTSAPAEQSERTLTVQETGKAPLKCKILKTWRTTTGATAHQVQALATGEMITIVETGTATPLTSQGPGSRLQAVSTRIYHWGRATTPPPGAPVPPAASASTAASAPAKRETAKVEPSKAEAAKPKTAPAPAAPTTAHAEAPKAAPAPAPAASVARTEAPKAEPKITAVVMPVSQPATIVAAKPASTEMSKPRVWPPAHGRSPQQTVVAVTPMDSAGQVAAAPVASPALPARDAVVPAARVTATVVAAIAKVIEPASPVPAVAGASSAAPIVTKTSLSESTTTPKPIPAETAPAAPLSKPILPIMEKAQAALLQLREAAPPTPRPRSITPVTKAPERKPALSVAEMRELVAQGMPVPPETKKVAPPPITVHQASAPGIAVPGLEATPLGPPRSETSSSDVVSVRSGGNGSKPLVIPPSNWRESWGKGEPSSPTVTMTSTKGEPVQETTLSAAPSAGERKRDPLQVPELYSRPPLEKLEPPSQRMASSRTTPSFAVEEKPLTQPVLTESDMTRRMNFIHHLRGTPIPLSEEEVAALQPKPSNESMPLGVQSIVAAGGTPGALPVPVMNIPPVRRQPQVMAQIPAQPPEEMVNAFSVPGTMSTGSMAQRSNPVVARAQPMPQVVGAVARTGFRQVADLRPAFVCQNFTEMQTALRDSLYPSQREWAAEGLSLADWRANPAVLASLLAAAQSDPSVKVRACCIRTLAKMKANTPAVLTALEVLKTDADAHLCEEAERALASLHALPVSGVRRAN